MGNACASCAGGAQDAVADAQAAAANMQAQRDAAKQEALDKKIESSDAKVDKEVMKERGVLNATMTALTQVVIEYQRVLDGDPTLSVLSVPQLSVWAAKEDADGNSTFCGDKVAKENIHLAAARIAMIAEARAEFLGDPAKDNVETFNEAKTEIKDAIKAIELYIEAELELPAIQTALEAAKDKHKEQELEVKGADEDKKDAEEAKLEKLEEIKEKAQEKFDEATEKIKDTKKEALDLAKGGKAGTDLIKKACQVRCKGYEKIDISVRAAVRVRTRGRRPVSGETTLWRTRAVPRRRVAGSRCRRGPTHCVPSGRAALCAHSAPSHLRCAARGTGLPRPLTYGWSARRERRLTRRPRRSRASSQWTRRTRWARSARTCSSRRARRRARSRARATSSRRPPPPRWPRRRGCSI